MCLCNNDKVHGKWNVYDYEKWLRSLTLCRFRGTFASVDRLLEFTLYDISERCCGSDIFRIFGGCSLFSCSWKINLSLQRTRRVVPNRLFNKCELKLANFFLLLLPKKVRLAVNYPVSLRWVNPTWWNIYLCNFGPISHF